MALKATPIPPTQLVAPSHATLKNDKSGHLFLIPICPRANPSPETIFIHRRLPASWYNWEYLHCCIIGFGFIPQISSQEAPDLLYFGQLDLYDLLLPPCLLPDLVPETSIKHSTR
jgi:hypothetical protein